MHYRNAAERAIRTLKIHFISGFSTTNIDFPIIEWYILLSKCVTTLNILCNVIFNPDISAYAYLYGPYDFTKYPMTLTWTRMIFHKKPGNHTPWGHHVTPVWYIGTSLDHYRCMKCYMPLTKIICITDTLQYTLKAFGFPNTTTEDYHQKEIGDII